MLPAQAAAVLSESQQAFGVASGVVLGVVDTRLAAHFEEVPVVVEIHVVRAMHTGHELVAASGE